MTIKEFYEWALEHNVENYELHTENWYDIRDIDIEIDNEIKGVTI